MKKRKANSASISQKIDEMHADIKEIKEKLLPNLDKRVAVVEVKAGLWGGLTGVMGGVLAAFGMK